MKLPNHTSLKEWSTVIDALGRGEQVLLIRKGGIADPTFGVEAERFYLFPTFFHSGSGEPPLSAVISHWAEVVKTWRVRDLELLYALQPFTIMDRANLDTRYRFREDQALHVLAVRAWRLPQPVTIVLTPAYAGCRSWVSIDDEIDVDGSEPALSEEALARRIEEVGSVLHAECPRVPGRSINIRHS
jgi:hypothetical protein